MSTTGIITTAIALAALGVILFFLLLLRYAGRISRLNEEISRITRDQRFERRVAASNRGDAVSRLGMTVNTLFEALNGQQERLVERQGLLHAIADNVPDLVVVHREEVLYANPAAAEWFSADLLTGRPITDLVRPALRRRVLDGVQEMLAGSDEAVSVELGIMDQRGRAFVTAVRAARIVYEGAPALLSVASPGVRAAGSLSGERRAEVTLESIGEGVLTTDPDGRIDYMNAAAQHLTGSSLAAARGKSLGDIISLVDESDRKSLGDPVSACLRDRRRVNLGRRALLLAHNGESEYSVELTASPQRGNNGSVVGAVVVLHDVSEMRGLTRQMSYQAAHDALTGLVNRREFERRLEESLQSAHSGNTGHVLCYLDLDRFKVVNDTSGHLAGDSMLREVATLIKDRVRDSDTVARLGGDEFGMLLIGCPLDKARQIADDVVAAIRDYRFVWRDKIFNIGVSIGLVEIGHESGSIEDLLSAADSACYVAKQQGRGRVHVYSARDEAAARQRGDIQWLQRLQTALKEDRFELYTQPVLSLAGHAQTGPAFEFLLRLRDESGRLVAPGEFLRAAERYHLTNHVDRWVVQSALSVVGRGALKLPDNRSCAINLSGQTLGDESFLDFVVECLDRSDVKPAQICFELSEASVATNLTHAKRLVDVLHSMGCSFALDDFGSGLGSFANLKNLGPDYVKLDGSLTHDLEHNSVNEAMVMAMIKLARSLGFQVIAEQVEDQKTLAAVRELGVDFVQGYVVGRPQPLG